jgi:hypothetical protein
MCWDKHKFRSDKFLGQVTLKFNKGLLSSNEKLDDWFQLKPRSKDEPVSGDVHLEIQYGDLKSKFLMKNSIVGSSSSTLLTSSSSNIEKTRTMTMSLTPETTPVKDLKVSAAFNTDETNAKLKMSTHVVVDEDTEEGNDNDFDHVRDGPSTVAMEKLTKDDKDITLSNKNLEVQHLIPSTNSSKVMNNSNEYSRFDWTKAGVRVNGGKWYYEVKVLASGSMYLGWCQSNYNPRVSRPSPPSLTHPSRKTTASTCGATTATPNNSSKTVFNPENTEIITGELGTSLASVLISTQKP